MNKYRWIVILVNLVLIFLYFTFAVVSKEELRSDGKLVLLKLAPVDPRSLMQGDYMQLRYAISADFAYDSIPKRGYWVVKIGPDQVADRVRVQKNRTPLNPGETLIEYTVNNWSINIGAESYFFQEGQSKKYEKAAYGGIMVDEKGNSLLVGLYDSTKTIIK